MTPQEKAEELFNSFLKFQVLTIGFENDINNEFTRRQRAKQCALIALDEVLKETKLHDKTIYEHGRTVYWQEVKQEIEKL